MPKSAKKRLQKAHQDFCKYKRAEADKVMQSCHRLAIEKKIQYEKA